MARQGIVEIGMSELDLLASVGPPDEIHRHHDPLDPGYFTDVRRESYVYRGRHAVHLERGHVVRVSRWDPEKAATPSTPGTQPQILRLPPAEGDARKFSPAEGSRSGTPSAATARQEVGTHE